MELGPGKSTTFDLDLHSGSTEYAVGKAPPPRTVKVLPPGRYRATFTFRFLPPLALKGGKFVEWPDAVWTGEVTAPAVKFEVAP